jgi:hypothetical protein
LVMYSWSWKLSTEMSFLTSLAESGICTCWLVSDRSTKTSVALVP